MDIYLVGGAVRDALLQRPVDERDWVVVGSSPQAMIDAGFRQVGRDFPVFLHPETGDEYALARTERKTGAGHTGFECYAAEDVTLEQDLLRRDLTINAMAQDADGRLIDPFGGRDDLRQRRLAHVSSAFVEDPLRVFRVARFAAALPEFRVAEETIELMASMAHAGALAELTAERVWVEWHKALRAEAPQRFFAVLAAAQALSPWFDGVDAAAMSQLYESKRFATDEARNAAFGWVHGAAATTALMTRLKAPKRFARPAAMLARHKAVLADWLNADPPDLLQTLISIGALRDSDVAATVLSALESCTNQSLETLRGLAAHLRTVKPSGAAANAKGAEYGAALAVARLDQIDLRQQALRQSGRAPSG